MTRLIWDNPSGPKYTSGVSQGVFFGKDGKGVAWSGLVGVTEKPQANAPTPIYNAAGTKYDIKGNVAEKKHALTCYIYPDVMDEYLGIEYLDDYGFQADERPPKPFHMAYRTETGNGHYEIHVLLSQIATFSDTARATLSTNATPSVLSMNLEGVPDPRFKSSHVILDSRLPITKSAEKLLFGDEFNDSDFNAFLTAEPVWETVAINYAPTIEPDYDNWVWLGGENLLNDSLLSSGFTYRDWVGQAWASYFIKPPDVASMLKPNTTYTASFDYEFLQVDEHFANLASSAGQLLLYSSGDVPAFNMARVDYDIYKNAQQGDIVHAVGTFTTPEDLTSYSVRIYTDRSESRPGFISTQRFFNIKIEEGTIATPWTPSPADTNQLPAPWNPTPEHYKPGIVGGKFWDSRNSSGRNSVVFWDEDRETAGLYSTSVSLTGNPPALVPIPDASSATIIPKELDATFSMEWEHLDNFGSQVLNTNYSAGTLEIARPVTISEKPLATRGRHVVSVRGVLDGGDIGVNRGVIRGMGVKGAPVSLIRKLMFTDSSYRGPFFDANSTPATKGDRYVRIPTRNGDATEHQQLRLRTTSNLVLRDITPFQYWIDAADSHLLLQGDTFTVSGPQVTMNGDLFTIDDSITGFSSDAT